MAERMNVVFLMPDQLRPDFLGCYGAGFVRTPHIDALCDGGTRYARALSPSPICVPMRASLLTGQNTIRTGVLTNYHWLRPDRAAMGLQTWPEMLGAAGYTTAGIGKMHFYPWDITEGFAYRAISEDKRHIHVRDDYAQYLERHGHHKYHGAEHEGYFEGKGAVVSRVPTEHQVDVWVANEACAYIERTPKDTPFAMMVGFPGPHCPYDPPPELAGMYDPVAMPASIPETAESAVSRESFIRSYRQPWCGIDYTEFTEAQKRGVRAHYAALVHQIDEGVGRILAAIAGRGIADRTVVIFAADHGDFLGDFARVGKSMFYECSARVPLIVRHPRMESPPVVDAPVSLTDVRATLLRFAGVERPETPSSVVLPGFAHGEDATRPFVFGATGGGTMIAEGDRKLVRYRSGVTLLTDVRDDPHEQRNLAGDPAHRETERRLDAMMHAETLRSVLAAHADKISGTHDDTPSFSMRGWRRTYPHRAPAG